MAYRKTKNYIITPKGVRIHKKEYDYFMKQVRSVNYGLGKVRKMTQGFEKPTYRKYPQTVYSIPKNATSNINKFKSIEEFREQMYKNEVLRNQLIKKPRAINEDINLSITNKLVRKARRKWTKELKRMTFLDRRNKQYKDNMKFSINDVMGGTEYADKLIEAIDSMTEAQFIRFWKSTPYEIIAYIYGTSLGKDNEKLENAYKNIMQYIDLAKSRKMIVPITYSNKQIDFNKVV